jgi:LacI family transcriptional regulator
MATIKEIAEIVGVSSSAVSRVLNYDEGISVRQERRSLPQQRKSDTKRE